MTKQKFEKMFPPPPEGKLLGFNVHSARYGTAEMFRLRPYQEKHPGTQKYGTIECEVSGEKNRYTRQPLVKRASVLVEILEPQIAEETAGMPGGINVRFFKRKPHAFLLLAFLAKGAVRSGGFTPLRVPRRGLTGVAEHDTLIL